MPPRKATPPSCGVAVVTNWRKAPEEAWSSPSWQTATVEYRESRGDRPLIVELDPKHLKRLRGLMRPGVTLEQAWNEFGDPRNKPVPKVVIETVMTAVRKRGLAALREPANIERLERCDAAARAEINQSIEMLGLKPCLTTLLAKRSRM
jgi:hypothetical protein